MDELGVSYISMHYHEWQTTNMHAYKDSFKEIGSIARIGFIILISKQSSAIHK